MKRGIMEMADIIAITKADGDNKMIAEGAKVLYENALHLFLRDLQDGSQGAYMFCVKKHGNRRIMGGLNGYYVFHKKVRFL